MLTTEVGTEDTVIVAISAPPRFVIASLLPLHPVKELRVKGIAVAAVHFAIDAVLRGLESKEGDFDPRMPAGGRFLC